MFICKTNLTKPVKTPGFTKDRKWIRETQRVVGDRVRDFMKEQGVSSEH